MSRKCTTPTLPPSPNGWTLLPSFSGWRPRARLHREGGGAIFITRHSRAFRNIEKRGLTVLSGTMNTPQKDLPDWKVAVISVTPKLSDPGASKRRLILVDRRLVASRPLRTQ